MIFDASFIDFVTSLFPSINPYVQEQTKHSLEQFYEHGKTFECYNNKPLDGICQGDIIENVNVPIIGIDGSINMAKRTVLIISNSCDIENDDYILIAPFYSFDEGCFSKSQIIELKNNKFFGKMYFPDVSEEEIFADFSYIQSMPKQYFIDGIKINQMRIKHSLNLVGFYLLLCKLTIHFMRPEDKQLQSGREHIDFILDER
ncbi:hypothetical protein [Treponema socranskii]|uniref:hypothetical protein n=1 Tax=Treponema socranskii TaxID=53419 RepID=UPI003D90FA56